MAYDVAPGDAEGDERGREAKATAVRLGAGEDGVVVDDGGAVAEDGGRALQEAQRRERAPVRRICAELARAIDVVCLALPRWWYFPEVGYAHLLPRPTASVQVQPAQTDNAFIPSTENIFRGYETTELGLKLSTF
jgi:hypothetical protein